MPGRDLLTKKVDNLANLPNVIHHAHRHGRRHPQRLVNAREIVVHEVQPPDAPAAANPSPGDDATAVLERLVWQELRECYDPEIPVNIVNLGLVYAMRSEPLPQGGHRVEVLMTVTSPACGMSEVLRSEADARIRKLTGVAEIEVAVTFDPPWTPELMTEDARLLMNM
jgi:metal-sulfur cluster biosynthetic enzyme